MRQREREREMERERERERERGRDEERETERLFLTFHPHHAIFTTSMKTVASQDVYQSTQDTLNVKLFAL